MAIRNWISSGRAMLYDALYRAFLLEAGNDAKWLDALLSERGLPLPAKP